MVVNRFTLLWEHTWRSLSGGGVEPPKLAPPYPHPLGTIPWVVGPWSHRGSCSLNRVGRARTVARGAIFANSAIFFFYKNRTYSELGGPSGRSDALYPHIWDPSASIGRVPYGRGGPGCAQRSNSRIYKSRKIARFCVACAPNFAGRQIWQSSIQWFTRFVKWVHVGALGGQFAKIANWTLAPNQGPN